MLAWSITHAGERTLVYGKDEQQAFRNWQESPSGVIACSIKSCRFDDCPCIDFSLSRETDFDQYAGGTVPVEAYFNAGWPMECESCRSAGYWGSEIHEPGAWVCQSGKAVCYECMICDGLEPAGRPAKLRYEAVLQLDEDYLVVRLEGRRQDTEIPLVHLESLEPEWVTVKHGWALCTGLISVENVFAADGEPVDDKPLYSMVI